MIPRGVQVFLALETIHLRGSFDRLCGAALEQVGYDARGGALFVFFGKRKSAIKVRFFDGSGMCIFYKRLDKGTFRMPEAPREGTRHIELAADELDARLDGIEIAEPRVHGHSRTKCDRNARPCSRGIDNGSSDHYQSRREGVGRQSRGQ
jgi:transposase